MQQIVNVVLDCFFLFSCVLSRSRKQPDSKGKSCKKLRYSIIVYNASPHIFALFTLPPENITYIKFRFSELTSLNYVSVTYR